MKLTVENRKVTGRKAKALILEDLIPASIYGPNRKSTNIQVKRRDFYKVFEQAGHSKIIDIQMDNGSSKALIREVQFDPVTDDVIHASFYELDLKKHITTDVPVITKGVSQAVKDNIGFLVTPFETLEVRCLPEKLPSEIVVEINDLNAIGDSVSVGELKLPEGVELTASISENATVAYIAPPQKEIVEEEEKPEVSEEEAIEEEEGIEEEEAPEEEEAAEGEEKEEAPEKPTKEEEVKKE